MALLLGIARPQRRKSPRGPSASLHAPLAPQPLKRARIRPVLTLPLPPARIFDLKKIAALHASEVGPSIRSGLIRRQSRRISIVSSQNSEATRSPTGAFRI